MHQGQLPARPVPRQPVTLGSRYAPGSPAPARTVWDACQALAWIAKDRREQQERVGRMMEIPELMQGVLSSA